MDEKDLEQEESVRKISWKEELGEQAKFIGVRGLKGFRNQMRG